MAAIQSETSSCWPRYQKPRYEIIGVVSDTKYRSLREIPPPISYTDDFGPKAYPDTFILPVRSHGDPRAVIEPVHRLRNSIDPELSEMQFESRRLPVTLSATGNTQAERIALSELCDSATQRSGKRFHLRVDLLRLRGP